MPPTELHVAARPTPPAAPAPRSTLTCTRRCSNPAASSRGNTSSWPCQHPLSAARVRTVARPRQPPPTPLQLDAVQPAVAHQQIGLGPASRRCASSRAAYCGDSGTWPVGSGNHSAGGSSRMSRARATACCQLVLGDHLAASGDTAPRSSRATLTGGPLRLGACAPGPRGTPPPARGGRRTPRTGRRPSTAPSSLADGTARAGRRHGAGGRVRGLVRSRYSGVMVGSSAMIRCQCRAGMPRRCHLLTVFSGMPNKLATRL